MAETKIRTGSIEDGTVLNEDIASNADIAPGKVLGTALTQDAASQTITGDLDVSGGTLVLPQGTSLPSGVEGDIFWKTDTDQLFVHDGTSFTEIGAGGGGEANTASNVGVGGVGVFKQKTGVDLEFKNVNAASSKISVVDDTGNNEVDLDVVEANITHNNLGGIGIDDHHARDHAAAHSESGADEINAEDLATASTDTSLVLKPDGTGGLVFTTPETENTVSTTDATVTTVATIAIPDNTAVLIKVDITGRRTNAADRAGYIRNAMIFREAAGSATLQGTVDSSLTRESSGGYNATIAVSGNNAIVTVKGLGGHNINWKSKHTVQEIA